MNAALEVVHRLGTGNAAIGQPQHAQVVALRRVLGLFPAVADVHDLRDLRRLGDHQVGGGLGFLDGAVAREAGDAGDLQRIAIYRRIGFDGQFRIDRDREAVVEQLPIRLPILDLDRQHAGGAIDFPRRGAVQQPVERRVRREVGGDDPGTVAFGQGAARRVRCRRRDSASKQQDGMNGNADLHSHPLRRGRSVSITLCRRGASSAAGPPQPRSQGDDPRRERHSPADVSTNVGLRYRARTPILRRVTGE
jgi:hypothetical protein